MSKHKFSHLESIYRNYDIRGKYGDEITDEEVEKIGKAIVKRFKTKKVAIGHDIRPSAEALSEAMKNGIISQGCDVVDLGLITTPMSYFVGGESDIDATVMITASHMPAEYNGLKITVEDAKPVPSDVLKELEVLVKEDDFPDAEKPGTYEERHIAEDWISFFRNKFSYPDSPIKLVVDPANMIGILDIQTFKAFEPELEVLSIYDEFDSTCPNHEANPLKPETLKDLGVSVVENKADIGIAFDGDADRVGIVDENGNHVRSDLVGALLAKYMLKEFPGSHVVYDLRSTRTVKRIIEDAGGTSDKWKVGHTNIRKKMREHESVLGIELAGHFFFKETNYSEGGPLPAFILMKMIHDQKRPLSELVSEVSELHHSGEINSEISRAPEEIYNELKEVFPGGQISALDGLSLDFPNWWLNVRPSANDPVLRLTLEADSEELMEEMRDKVLGIIRA